jgi:hypothetical protein
MKTLVDNKYLSEKISSPFINNPTNVWGRKNKYLKEADELQNILTRGKQ